MQNAVVKGFLKYIKETLDEFYYLLDDFYNPERGWNDTLNKRLAQQEISKREKNWVSIMWNISHPNPLSYRPKLFKGKDVQFVNTHGDRVTFEEAMDPVTRELRKGYSAVSPDYRWTFVSATLSLDFVFNSLDEAIKFQELFTMRVYMSNSAYLDLPIVGKCCVHINDVAMGDIDKYDRSGQGTLLSLPIDFVLHYPLIEPVKPVNKGPYEPTRKTLIQEIITNVTTEKYDQPDKVIRRKRYV